MKTFIEIIKMTNSFKIQEDRNLTNVVIREVELSEYFKCKLQVILLPNTNGKKKNRSTKSEYIILKLKYRTKLIHDSIMKSIKWERESHIDRHNVLNIHSKI